MGTVRVSILINLEDYLRTTFLFSNVCVLHVGKMSTICNKQTTSSQHVLWWGSWVSIHMRYHVSHYCKCDMWHFFCIACLFENQPIVWVFVAVMDSIGASLVVCKGTPCSVTTSSWRRRRIRWRPTWSFLVSEHHHLHDQWSYIQDNTYWPLLVFTYFLPNQIW